MINIIFDWIEVWVLLIPIFVLFTHRKISFELKPVVYYLFIALALNIAASLIYNQKKLGWNLPWHKNVILYDIHSIIRLLLFSLFFIRLNQSLLVSIKKYLPVLFLVFVIVDVSIFHDSYNDLINIHLHALESGILLFYCLQYYLYLFLLEEKWSFKKMPSFWIVTGLSIFIVVSFPIYLFYKQLIKQNVDFVVNVWIVQKIAFLIFCLFTAKGLSESK
jgi:hypothetical protein